MVTDIALYVVFTGLIAVGIWMLYTLLVVSHKAKDVVDEEAPYKVEIPSEFTKNVAVSDPFEEWETPSHPDHFEPYCKPKRKYTKRSKYWTDKRKKAAARKAKKKTRKSK